VVLGHVGYINWVSLLAVIMRDRAKGHVTALLGHALLRRHWEKSINVCWMGHHHTCDRIGQGPSDVCSDVLEEPNNTCDHI